MAAGGQGAEQRPQSQFVAVLAAVAGWSLMPTAMLQLALVGLLECFVTALLSTLQVSASSDRLVGSLLRVDLSKNFSKNWSFVI